MDQPAHLLASRPRAEKAISSGGGNDPAAQGRLAQTEALLAVAAATGRLAGARSAIQARPPCRRRRPPVARSRGSASSTPTPACTGPRKRMRRCSPPARARHDMPTLADTFGRQPSAILSRLNHLGAARAPQPGGTATLAGAGPQP
jgi:hypothetical protein